MEAYNLFDTEDDIKGMAFERFLGTTFRGELGQFFTPRTIVNFMTEILDPQEGETICDPCCGSGGFLIKVFEYIREKIVQDIKTQKKKLRQELEEAFQDASENGQAMLDGQIERMQTLLNRELDAQAEGSRLYRLSRDCIYGTDANPRMARVAKMNMIMHGDGHGGVHHHNGLLNVNGIFEQRFDVILTNPPFGATVDKGQVITKSDQFTDKEAISDYRKRYGDAYDQALKQVDDHMGKKILSLFDLGGTTALTEVLFMERCLRLLKRGGRMGIVLPEGVLNNKNLQSVREYFEGRAKILLICSIPQDVFLAAGATVKPSLVFLKRFTKEEEALYAKCREEAFVEARRPYQEDLAQLQLAREDGGQALARIKEEVKSNTSLLRKMKKERSDGIIELEEKILELKSQQTEQKMKIKEIERRLKEIERRIAEDARPILRRKFDYEIPIAKIEDAGITSTGGVSKENQLPQLLKEYRKYCEESHPWEAKNLKIEYSCRDNAYYRVENGEEVKQL